MVRRADLTDCESIVRIHLLAFERFFLASLGYRFLRAFYKTLLRDDFSIAVVSKEDGALIGFALGASKSQGLYRRLVRRHWFRMGFAALPALLRRPAALVRIMKTLCSSISETSAASSKGRRALLMSLAVDPNAQRQGSGRMLIEAFCRGCQEAGCCCVELTTDAHDNELVRRFYERNGFIAEEIFEAYGQRPMVRYVRELEG